MISGTKKMVKQTKILFFSSFPPPYTGQTIATQAIFDLLKEHYIIKKLSFSIENRGIASGNLKISSIFHSIKMSIKLASHLLVNRKYDFIYTVPSSTKVGLLRDFLYLITIKITPGRKKIIYHVHSGDFGLNFTGFLGRIFDFNLSKVDRIILLSKSLKKFTGHETKTVYIKNFVDTSFAIKHDELEEKTNRKTNEISVLFVSNLIKTKGFEDLIEAAKKLSQSPIVFHFVGKWESLEDQSKWQEELKSISNIKIHGQISSRDEIRKLYLEGDVFCLPTYYPIEALPLSIIEAMSLANPIITTNHAAIPDIVKHRHNGFLVEKKKSDEIVACLSKLMDRKVWKEMSRHSYEYYNENLKPMAVLPLYNEILTRKS